MIFINIEIKDHNKFKDFFHKVASKCEDMLFTLITKIPEKFIPSFLMSFLERYTAKRLAELQHQVIKSNWERIALKKALEEISDK